MRLAGFVVLAVMGCGVDEPATSQVQAADTSSQGSSMQGSSMQGSSMQGSSMQGSSMQGSSMQGATLGGLSASGITISGTAIIAWTHNADGTWDQRTPNRLCHYKSDKTTLIGCTTVFKSNPLVGLTFTGSFIGPNGSATARVRIASVASDSTTQAMFPVTGTANATHQNCENPAGCSSNADLWLYDVNLPDFIEPNGLPVSLCPTGEKAFALAGVWDTTGKFSASKSSFTFACTNGTIAKCTRWGYRPWATATMSDGITTSPLAPYHQACLRAAMADYCGMGVSFTHNGTLVDVYDYPKLGAVVGVGFIPRQRWVDPSKTMFTFESTFDPLGATEIDHTRYQELQQISSPDNVCPGRFWTGSGDVGLNWNRDAIKYPIDNAHQVSINSAPACAHSEWTIGKWLKAEDPANGNSDGCSVCTNHVLFHGANPSTGYFPNAYCVSPTGKWDANCKSIAQQDCTGAFAPAASHSECTEGGGLPKYATGCTLRVELTTELSTDPITHETTSGCATLWDSVCVAAAASLCTGGQESVSRFGVPLTNFCGGTIGIGTL